MGARVRGGGRWVGGGPRGLPPGRIGLGAGDRPGLVGAVRAPGVPVPGGPPLLQEPVGAAHGQAGPQDRDEDGTDPGPGGPEREHVVGEGRCANDHAGHGTHQACLHTTVKNLLGVDPAVGLLGQEEPPQAVEDQADAGEDVQHQPDTADQDRIHTQATGHAARHAPDPPLVTAYDAKTPHRGEEARTRRARAAGAAGAVRGGLPGGHRASWASAGRGAIRSGAGLTGGLACRAGWVGGAVLTSWVGGRPAGGRDLGATHGTRVPAPAPRGHQGSP